MQQSAIIEKVPSRQFGNAEDEMPMGTLNTLQQSHSPNSTTRFWWHDGWK